MPKLLEQIPPHNSTRSHGSGNHSTVVLGSRHLSPVTCLSPVPTFLRSNVLRFAGRTDSAPAASSLLPRDENTILSSNQLPVIKEQHGPSTLDFHRLDGQS